MLKKLSTKEILQLQASRRHTQCPHNVTLLNRQNALQSKITKVALRSQRAQLNKDRAYQVRQLRYPLIQRAKLRAIMSVQQVSRKRRS